MHNRIGYMLIVGLMASYSVAHAGDLYVYPAQGQSPDQQARDEGECLSFGRNQTGFDPMSTPTATQPAPQQRGSVMGGAARGALVGGLIDGSDGAKKGAAAGGLIGGMRKNNSRREQQSWENQQAQNYSANRDSFNRAYGACLEGRGYTVR